MPLMHGFIMVCININKHKYKYVNINKYIYIYIYIYCILRGRIKGFNHSITTILFEVGSYRTVFG